MTLALASTGPSKKVYRRGREKGSGWAKTKSDYVDVQLVQMQKNLRENHERAVKDPDLKSTKTIDGRGGESERRSANATAVSSQMTHNP